MSDKNLIVLRVGDVLPNPHKASIAGGKLDQHKLEVLKNNYKDGGIIDCWPVRKNKQGKYELVGAHHRLRAAREMFGAAHELRFQLVSYDDAEMLRGMIDENLAGDESKSLPLQEQADYVEAARGFLVSHPDACKLTKQHDHGNIDCVKYFLGDSWTVERIRIFELLDPSLGHTDGLRETAAKRLVQLPKAAQREVAKIMGEDAGQRQIKRILDATKEDRKALSELSGKAAQVAEQVLVRKVTKLANVVVAEKKNPMMGISTSKLPLARKLSRSEVILAFFDMTSLDAMKLAWKHQAALYHPDHGGNSKQATAFNELWSELKKLYGKDS